MTEQAVTFDSAGLKLAGTLTVPDGVQTAPALLFLPGSGQADRDDNVKRLPIDLFPPIAQAVGEIGFVTFRYDKRGVGASAGDYWTPSPSSLPQQRHVRQMASGIIDRIRQAALDQPSRI
jgi:hypothetical protein